MLLAPYINDLAVEAIKIKSRNTHEITLN